MAKNFSRISYYNLREEIANEKLPSLIGRAEEVERITRVIGRRINNNVLIVGPSGIGKTTFVHGWLKHLSTMRQYDSYQFIQFESDHVYSFSESDYGGYADALITLPSCVLFVDGFGHEMHNNSSLMQLVSRLYTMLLKESDVRVVLTLEPQEFKWLQREFPAFVQLFETLALKNQTTNEYVQILHGTLGVLNEHRIEVTTSALTEIITYVERFPTLGQLPHSAISILDESISSAVAKGSRALRSTHIAEVVADRTGIPATQLSTTDLSRLQDLERVLNARIISQQPAIAKIAATLQRAKLGLRNPDKPLGSFLILGPSGVGKTETAKLIAETMFGRPESFTRFDMSEFQQDHTIQRLIGAPAGYVGYEEGGALTNALRREPHSLILLDEIEKAHPKIFDIFLQVLDDGRLTSGQNETVDARNAIFMATSNIGVDEIITEFEQGLIADDAFVQQKIVPQLAKTFRLEFINRFDSILIFNPLTLPGLVEIAQLEVKKIEKRLAHHKVQFDFDPKVIEARIKGMADPRFGARPVKRFIEETCESLLVRSLLAKNDTV